VAPRTIAWKVWCHTGAVCAATGKAPSNGGDGGGEPA
jgi:hypothetical protein